MNLKTESKVMYVARLAKRRPFSTIFNGRQITMFYYGGWNMISAELAIEFPNSTYERKD